MPSLSVAWFVVLWFGCSLSWSAAKVDTVSREPLYFWLSSPKSKLKLWFDTGPSPFWVLSIKIRLSLLFCRTSRLCYSWSNKNSSFRLWRFMRELILFLICVYSFLGTNLRKKTNFFMSIFWRVKAKRPSLISPVSRLIFYARLISDSQVFTWSEESVSLCFEW